MTEASGATARRRKVVIITGGTRGIGLATARLFAADGHAVMLASRSPGSGREALGALGDVSGVVGFTAADVGQPADVERLVQATVSRFGGLDILINNAAVSIATPLLETHPDDWDAVLNVNLKGHFLCAKAAVPHMIDRGSGVIVNTSSVLAFGAVPNSGAYVASKAGIIGLTKAMAVEWIPLGIRVNCIVPGSTDTDMMWAGVPPESITAARQELDAAIPAGRLATPDQIANATHWLCSDEATYVVGTVLTIDGGLMSRARVPR